MQSTILVVNQEPALAWTIERALRHEDIELLSACSITEAKSILGANKVDVVISDQCLLETPGSEFLGWVGNNYPDTVGLLLAREQDLHAVVAAINSGQIYKFLSKPWTNDALRTVVRDAVGKAHEGQIDPKTGWLTQRAFCARASSALGLRQLRIVVCEIRNATTAWAMLDSTQGLQLAQKIADRCIAAAGETLVPHASLERGLFAFALDRALDESSLEGIFERLGTPITLDGKAISLMLDFGYADSEPGEQDGGALLRRAMVALTSLGNDNPRRIARYSGDTTTNLHQRHSLERDMTRALGRNEFFIQIQPQVSTRNFQIIAGETLMRWRHPLQGLISPMQFIDMAERNGFINEIGLWVANKTVQTLEALDQAGADWVRLSLNVSPRQFLGAQTAGWAMLLRDYAFDSPELLRRLELEITESTILHDQRLAYALLAEFKEMGLRIALDDFGTGYSSLSQIMELPLDVLKLDRSLIRDIEHNPRSRIMVTHLTRMSHDLGLEVIAEGVETQAQIDLCQELQCDLIQRYASHRPLDLPDFMKVLDKERPANLHGSEALIRLGTGCESLQSVPLP